jgi:hypothetical protein
VARIRDLETEAALAPTLRTIDELAGGHRVVGLGWATVELERAERELRARFGIGPFEDASADVHLGAHARRRGDVVALEPSTEGRLAAFLVRHGEGPAALYVALPPGLEAALPPAGVVLSAAAAGPFGEQRLRVGGRPDEPRLVLVRVPSA